MFEFVVLEIVCCELLMSCTYSVLQLKGTARMPSCNMYSVGRFFLMYLYKQGGAFYFVHFAYATIPNIPPHWVWF